MDPITHAALGAASAQAVFGKYNKSIPWQVGALAAMAPDLDIFISCKNNLLCLELWHRSFTHSLLFIPLGGLLIALLFLCIPFYRKTWKITLGASLIAYASHAVLDALTSYGTCLLWPINYHRSSWDIIAIVDPLFTIILILGTFWSILFKDQKGVILGLCAAALFLVFNSLQHYRALQSIHVFAKQNHLDLYDIRAMPNLASSISWRGIAKYEGCLLISNIHTPLFQKSTVTSLMRVPLLTTVKNLNLSTKNQQTLAVFFWFTDNYTIIAKNHPLIVADGRYTIGDHKIYSLWGLKIASDKDEVAKLKYILLEKNGCFKNSSRG